MSERKTKMLKVLEEYVEEIKNYFDDVIDRAASPALCSENDAPDGCIDGELLYWDLDKFGVDLRGSLLVTFREYNPLNKQ